MESAIARHYAKIHPQHDDASLGQHIDMIAEEALAMRKKYPRHGYFWGYRQFLLEIAKDRPALIAQHLQEEGDTFLMKYGIDSIDGVNQILWMEFWQVFADWFIKNHDKPDYDYNFETATEVARAFEIPTEYLSGILANPIFQKLHAWKTGQPQPAPCGCGSRPRTPRFEHGSTTTPAPASTSATSSSS